MCLVSYRCICGRRPVPTAADHRFLSRQISVNTLSKRRLLDALMRGLKRVARLGTHRALTIQLPRLVLKRALLQ
jgi:hypothetical protein